MNTKQIFGLVIIIIILIIAGLSSLACICFPIAVIIEPKQCDWFEWILILIPNIGFWTGITGKHHIINLIDKWTDM